MNGRPRHRAAALLAAVAFGPLAWWVASATLAPSPALAQPPAAPIDLGAQLEEIRAAGNVPALAAAVVTADGVVARGAAGVRKQGDETPVAVSDLWHIGSITKSFTSATFARLVEAGRMRWDEPLAEVLPEAAGTPFAQATFAQLLSHHASLPANPSMASLGKSRTSTDPLTEQRRQIVAEVLAIKPVNPLGSFFLYSNAGYVTVGAALERLTEMPWEELVRAQILTPLGLRRRHAAAALR